jgi:hypothetical protein
MGDWTTAAILGAERLAKTKAQRLQLVARIAQILGPRALARKGSIKTRQDLLHGPISHLGSRPLCPAHNLRTRRAAKANLETKIKVRISTEGLIARRRIEPWRAQQHLTPWTCRHHATGKHSCSIRPSCLDFGSIYADRTTIFAPPLTRHPEERWREFGLSRQARPRRCARLSAC